MLERGLSNQKILADVGKLFPDMQQLLVDTYVQNAILHNFYALKTLYPELDENVILRYMTINNEISGGSKHNG